MLLFIYKRIDYLVSMKPCAPVALHESGLVSKLFIRIHLIGVIKLKGKILRAFTHAYLMVLLS